MILGRQMGVLAAQQPSRRATLDEVLRRIAQRQPDKPALLDPPDRERFTDGAPRQLTYAQADLAVSAIAGRLHHMGLSTDAVVGIQLPNIVENILATLGVMRAGMIAAPLPLLWRRADAVAALGSVGARALITCGHVGGFRHCQLAMRIASEVFSIRYVCSFGQDPPDGVVPFDDLLGGKRPDPIPPFEPDRQDNAADHIGLITFDIGENGIVPVARNHVELFAGGIGVTLEGRLAQGARILSTMAPSSFAGFSLTVLPWLLSAGTLSLHQPFAPEALLQQIREDRCRTVVIPAALAPSLIAGDALSHAGLATVLGAWRSPERLATSPSWRGGDAVFVDVQIFGETGLVATRRAADGRPALVPFGPVVAPRGGRSGITVAETLASPAGTIMLRGAMVPRYPFPPGVERSGLPHLNVGTSGLIDTGYRCRVDSVTGAMVVTAAPSGIVTVGGYRLPLRELQEAVRRIDGSATLAALPDPLIGQRLIGNAPARSVVAAALRAVGVNPLVAAAFTDRSADAAAISQGGSNAAMP